MVFFVPPEALWSAVCGAARPALEPVPAAPAAAVAVARCALAGGQGVCVFRKPCACLNALIP